MRKPPIPPIATEDQLQFALDSQYRSKSPLRVLWLLYRDHRKKLALMTFFYIIKQSPVWVIPIVFGEIVTKVAEAIGHNGQPADPQALNWVYLYSFVIGILIIQNPLTHTVYSYYLSAIVRQVQLVLRSALVVRLQQLSMSFHDDVQSGKLQSKVLRDVDAVEMLSRAMIEYIFQTVIVVIVAMAVTLRKAPTMTLFFLVTIPAGLILMRLFNRRLREGNKLLRKEVEEMSSRVAEMIEMIPVTRAHAVESVEVERLHKQLLKIRNAGQHLDTTNNLFASCGWATFQTFSLVCLLFSCWQFYHGTIKDIGDIMMYQGFFGLIMGSVQGAVSIIPQFTAGVESIRSIGEVLESPDVEHNDEKLQVEDVRGEIEFDDVTYKYPHQERAAIKDFSLKITSGECVAVVGESGSGKSTLMNLIIGFRRPTTGRLLLDGQDTANLNFRSIRRFVAVVPQHTVLFSGTIRENITYGLSHINDAKLQEILDMANCTEFISKLPQGLDTPLGGHGGKLSGGQRQRIAIARALLRDPRIIILDEATSALDVVSEHLVQQAINRLIQGRTTLIVAHRLSTIRNANRIVVMGDGKILEIGTHDELLAREDSAFSKLHALQV